MHRGLARGLVALAATGALVGGGAAIASAATGGGSHGTTGKSGSTTTPAPSAPAPSSRHHCPHMSGSAGNGSSFGGAGTAPSQST